MSVCHVVCSFHHSDAPRVAPMNEHAEGAFVSHAPSVARADASEWVPPSSMASWVPAARPASRCSWDAAELLASVIATMKVHLDNARVERHACIVLGNITRGHVVRQECAGRAGALETVVAAMSGPRHSTDEAFLEAACDTLAVLLDECPVNQRRARAAGVGAAVQAVLVLEGMRAPAATNWDRAPPVTTLRQRAVSALNHVPVSLLVAQVL